MSQNLNRKQFLQWFCTQSASTRWTLWSPSQLIDSICHLVSQFGHSQLAKCEPKFQKVSCVVSKFHQLPISSVWEIWTVVQIISSCYKVAIPLAHITVHLFPSSRQICLRIHTHTYTHTHTHAGCLGNSANQARIKLDPNQKKLFK